MAFGTYAEYQAAPSSEKIILAVIEARRRLLGWVLDSGSIYKLASFDAQRVVSIEDSGTAYVEGSSASLSAGQYFHDRAAGVLYLRASDSSNPNSRFLVMAEGLYFSNVGISAPYDHGTWGGYEVYYRDGLESTSEFGVELDTENQLGEALEGTGTFSFMNDQEYWRPVFEKKSFSNGRAYAYSWNRDLPITEAKILYRGKISGKTYDEKKITFTLVDGIVELRAPVQLTKLSDIGGARIPTNLYEAFQRRLYGEAQGIRPVSLDQILTGYPLAGTVSNQSYVVTTEANYIDFIESFGGTVKSVAVPAGNYTTTSLALAIKTAMQTLSVQTITVSYDGSTGKWSIQGSGLYLAILWETGANVAKSIGPTIGFNNSSDSGNSNTADNTSDRPFLSDRSAKPRGLVGVGTSFLSKLSPEDQLVIGTETWTVERIESDTQAVLTSDPVLTYTGASFQVKPKLPKRYANRTFVIAGHALREPSTTVLGAPNTSQLVLNDATDFEADCDSYILGEVIPIRGVTPGNIVRLDQNLESVPSPGTAIKRLAVTNVHINSQRLDYPTDYTYDAATARLTLDPLAEFNRATEKSLSGTLSFTNASRKVLGVNTGFTSELTANSWIRSRFSSTWYEVLQVISDTELWVRAAANFTASDSAIARDPAVYNESSDVLAVDALGATVDGTTSGEWINTAPDVVKDLLIEAGLGADIDTATFALSRDLAYQRIGLAVPETYDDTTAPIYRDVISAVNKSVFGSLIQTPDFLYQYNVLRPRRVATEALRLDEADAITWSVKAQLDKIVKTVRVEYQKREYDYSAGVKSSLFSSNTSKIGDYVAKATAVYDHVSLLVRAADADTLAQRLAFLLSSAYTTVSIMTKLQAARSKISDVIDFSHEKLYQREASSSSRKVGQIRLSKRDAAGSEIQIEDLANAFTRCGTITPSGANNFSNSGEADRLFSGFITDLYGMQNNNADTYGVNRIW
jgi:hypothetical protein